VSPAVFFSTDKFDPSDIGYVDSRNGVSAITSGNGDIDDTPVPSPDGTKIAYTSSAGTSGASLGLDLWVANIDGTSPHKVFGATTTFDGAPMWSPDGSLIAFNRISTTTFVGSVWIVPSAGGAARKVGGDGLLDPAWSPSGRLLAVSDVNQSHPVIAVMTADGSTRWYVAGTSGTNFAGFDPGWSADGTKIAFVRQTDAGARQLAVVPSGGSMATAWNAAATDVNSQTWSPDGSRIVFDRQNPTTGSSTVWQIDSIGQNVAQLPGTASYHCAYPAVLATAATYTPATVAPITGLSAVLGNGSATLSYTKPAAAAGVIVRRSAAGGPAPATPEAGFAVPSTTTKAMAIGLANGQTYAFSVFAVNASGDVSSSVTRSLIPAATPTVSPNGSVLGVLFGSGPKFTAKWGGNRSATDGRVFDVQIGSRTFTNGAWSAVMCKSLVTGTKNGSLVVNAAAGTPITCARGCVTSSATRGRIRVPRSRRCRTTIVRWRPPVRGRLWVCPDGS